MHRSTVENPARDPATATPEVGCVVGLEDVHVRLGERDVLRGVTTELRERRIGIVGANGSGKSTLARLLNGLVLPTRGTVRVDGLDTRRSGAHVRRRVGFVMAGGGALLTDAVDYDGGRHVSANSLALVERAVDLPAGSLPGERTPDGHRHSRLSIPQSPP